MTQNANMKKKKPSTDFVPSSYVNITSTSLCKFSIEKVYPELTAITLKFQDEQKQ